MVTPAHAARSALIATISQDAAEPNRMAFQERLRSHLSSHPAARLAMVGLIEDLVSANEDLSDVSPVIAGLLRSQLAATAVQEAFAVGLDPSEPDEVLTPDDVLRIARVRGQAHANVLSEPMLDASGLAAALGSTSSNPREFARMARMRPGLLSLRRGNRFLFPAFQFDLARGRIWPIVAEVNTELDSAREPWATASFWFTMDSVLGGRPADRVADPIAASAIRAAMDRELAPID